jgi:hypothetical protein
VVRCRARRKRLRLTLSWVTRGLLGRSAFRNTRPGDAPHARALLGKRYCTNGAAVAAKVLGPHEAPTKD